MSGVRGDARKRQQESQPAPEVGLTEAEREALVPFIWGGWIGVTKGREADYSRELQALVAHIKADATQQERAAWVAKTSSLLARFTHSESCSAHHPDDRVADEDCDCWRRALSSDATEAGLTDGHLQFTDKSGTWCLKECPRPEAECGALAVLQNDSDESVPEVVTATKSSGEIVDLLAALQKSIAAAKARLNDGSGS